MPTFKETMFERFVWNHVPALQPVKQEMARVIETGEAIQSKHAAVTNDTKLTPVGKQDAIRSYIAKEAVTNLFAAHKSLELMQRKINDRRASLVPKMPDRSDLAGAVVRADIRSMLRAMPFEQRLHIAMADDADPILQSAILELPAYASGLVTDIYSHVKSTVVERENPGALAALAEWEEAFVIFDATVRYVADTTITAAEFPNNVQHLWDFVAASVGDRASAIVGSVNQYFAPMSAA